MTCTGTSARCSARYVEESMMPIVELSVRPAFSTACFCTSM